MLQGQSRFTNLSVCRVPRGAALRNGFESEAVSKKILRQLRGTAFLAVTVSWRTGRVIGD